MTHRAAVANRHFPRRVPPERFRRFFFSHSQCPSSPTSRHVPLPIGLTAEGAGGGFAVFYCVYAIAVTCVAIALGTRLGFAPHFGSVLWLRRIFVRIGTMRRPALSMEWRERRFRATFFRKSVYQVKRDELIRTWCPLGGRTRREVYASSHSNKALYFT